MEEAVDVLPTLFSYDPMCSLEMDYKPERWDPGSDSAHIHPCVREEENLVIIREKILHHLMRGDRAEFNTVAASLFLRLAPSSYYRFTRSFLQAPTVGFPFHTIFWTQCVTFRTV